MTFGTQPSTGCATPGHDLAIARLRRTDGIGDRAKFAAAGRSPSSGTHCRRARPRRPGPRGLCWRLQVQRHTALVAVGLDELRAIAEGWNHRRVLLQVVAVAGGFDLDHLRAYVNLLNEFLTHDTSIPSCSPGEKRWRRSRCPCRDTTWLHRCRIDPRLLRSAAAEHRYRKTTAPGGCRSGRRPFRQRGLAPRAKA